MPASNQIDFKNIRLPYRVAVISDTHVPDRQPRLPATLLDLLKIEEPDRIFHCGDISTPEAVQQLESIAPLTAVLGNRDFIFRMNLPLDVHIEIGGVKVTLTHGQGSAWRYFKDKLKYLTTGYDFDRYRHYFDADFPDAELVIFGHTHTPVDIRIGGRRYFNAGATYPCPANDFTPRIGRIEFSGAGKYSTSFINI
jgi:putative phosphoesterase